VIRSFAEVEDDVVGTVGYLLRELQAERGLSDADLHRLGVCKFASTLSGYLSGQQLPDPRIFIDILTALGSATPIPQQRVDLLHAVYQLEWIRRARYKSDPIERVTESRSPTRKGASGANRAPGDGKEGRVNKRGDDLNGAEEPAGEGGFEPPIV
jgi:transcriptional regulator with XRE-family HTH domain